MADRTGRTHSARLVTADATCHGGYGSRFRHDMEVGYCAMARSALSPRFQMLAMRPRNSRQHVVDSYPGNRFVRIGIFGELFDRRPVGDHLRVTGHAGRSGRERHLVARRGVGMTEHALQTHADMGLVTERQWLLWSRVRRGIFPNSRRGRCRGHRMSRMNGADGEQHERGSDHRNHIKKLLHCLRPRDRCQSPARDSCLHPAE
jgi:hypothetical protein